MKLTKFFYFYDVMLNFDFRKFLKSISFRYNIDEKLKVFCYCDPPYLSTDNNYDTQTFTEQDSLDLFDILQERDIKFAYSEFKHPFILDQAKKRGLNVYEIAERRTLKNRAVEILVTNYDKRPSLF